jgi:hypothetical protein
MTPEELILVEKVEKLAFQAGSAGGKKSSSTHPLMKKLKALGLYNSANTGTALYGPNASDNIEWSEIIAFAKEE